MVRKVYKRKNQQALDEETPSIIWLPEARADTRRLYDFLFEKNPLAAARALSAIFGGAQFVASSPYVGRPMLDDTGRREWLILFGSGGYILRYSLTEEETPIIIRVWHSREQRD